MLINKWGFNLFQSHSIISISDMRQGLGKAWSWPAEQRAAAGFDICLENDGRMPPGSRRECEDLMVSGSICPMLKCQGTLHKLWVSWNRVMSGFCDMHEMVVVPWPLCYNCFPHFHVWPLVSPPSLDQHKGSTKI